MATINPKLLDVLLAAYQPCAGFYHACTSMRWDPASGYVPRGFYGATGSLEEVKLVLVGAEPGDPHSGESHAAEEPSAQFQSAYNYAGQCFHSGTDLYHRNMRLVLEMCWPDETFEQHMRKTWITDSVLCSAQMEGGRVPAIVTRECRSRYLQRQLALFPDAVVVALGNKAYQRLAGYPGIIKAFAVAPPGCNRRDARESWSDVARAVRARAT